MKLKRFVLLISSLMTGMYLLVGCAKTENDDLVVEKEPVIKEDAEETTEFTFADVSGWGFWFGSGAGAWSTELSIYEDGSFEGLYHDSDMGAYDEAYPNGTVYVCNFRGRFTQPEKVNDYTYSMKIENIELEHEPDTEELEDEMRYIYTEPYGLEEAEDILIYLPGAPVAELPEGFLSWMNAFDFSNTSDEELPFYGLYNVVAENGFSSSDYSNDASIEAESASIEAESASIEEEMVAIEEEISALEDKLQADDVTQTDMNIISGEIYRLWDDELNAIWKRLTETVDEDTMAALLAEQRECITQKEKEVEAAGAEYEGGSMQTLITNDKAAELTRERVYELIEMLH